jgi:hypothetical protein
MSEMETRPYFVIGDLIMNTLAGAVAGGLMALIFGADWNMFVAMIVGMALGMVIALPLSLLGSALFGAMEVMLPVMTSGMLAGMVVSMGATMNTLSFLDGTRLGSLCGIAVMIVTYIVNAIVKQRADKWTQ